MALSSVICINKHVLNFANVALLCVAKPLATLGCMHILTYNIFVHQSGGRVARVERAGFAGKSLHNFKIHLFLQNVLQNLVRSTSKSVTSRCFVIFKEFSYSCLFSGDNFASFSGFIGIYFGRSLNIKRS